MPRSFWRWAGAAAAAVALVGCGSRFDLPTENRANRLIPEDESYQMVATWTGMDGIADILLTQGSGTQLFLLFNRGGAGTAPRGEVRSYTRLKPTGTPDPIPGIDFSTLFNPIALCSGGDGAGSPNNRVYVLDRGDTCLARANPASGGCDTTRGWNLRISNLGLYWRVREFGLLGGDTLSTFTDTTMASVNGVASDREGRVYVSGLAIILVPDPNDPRILTRLHQWRVYRYARGPLTPGVFPPDRRMPGANWHRDPNWRVEEGSGIGTLVDPRGLFWTPSGAGALYAADFAKNWVQKLSDQLPSMGIHQIDSAEPGESLNGPLDVAADLQGFAYVVDQGNRRVLRFDSDGAYVQRVDVEPDAFGRALGDPVAVAANDSLVYVADPASSTVIRYKRRK